ncbi:hypothetical protein B0J11DRAFT_265058 [Dendryphion nanum]|uniref:Uncharacterized protein n=1 Tax=Dendryphion nanum TaxID=256645 RepID=A0A9P9DYQ9_9PLEO|nr:hypothetical protein B0J11DRAFT_265058 [Dendryphion nanum]
MLSATRSTARQPRKWTPVEDQKLREEVEIQRSSEGEAKDWCKVAQSLPGRTNKDCRKRWMNSVAGGLKKGQWSKSEDALLSKGVHRYGQKWTLVAEVVGSRSADQCSKRWCQSLDPDLDRSEWRDSEDHILLEAVGKLGRHWKDVQHYHFPGRSKNSIKNRYTVLLRRYGNPVPHRPSRSGSGSSSPGKSNAAYSNAEDESYGIGYDAVPSPSPVSTPGTRGSWPIEDDSFSAWPTTPGISIAPTAAPSTTAYPQIKPDQSNWNWVTQPTTPTLHISSAPQNSYVPYPHTATSPYSSNGLQHMFGHPAQYSSNQSHDRLMLSSPQIIAPTSSPRAPTILPLHDPNSSHRYLMYGAQGDPAYGY